MRTDRLLWVVCALLALALIFRWIDCTVPPDEVDGRDGGDAALVPEHAR